LLSFHFLCFLFILLALVSFFLFSFHFGLLLVSGAGGAGARDGPEKVLWAPTGLHAPLRHRHPPGLSAHLPHLQHGLQVKATKVKQKQKKRAKKSETKANIVKRGKHSETKARGVKQKQKK
jgi:hypothetical protein